MKEIGWPERFDPDSPEAHTLIVYLPFADRAKSVHFFCEYDRAECIGASFIVSAVILETHPLTRHLYNHPSIDLWRDNLPWLLTYGLELMDNFPDQWGQSDFRERKEFYHTQMTEFLYAATEDGTGLTNPWFLGNEQLHRSHLSHLLTQHPTRYLDRLDDAEYGLPLYWPVRTDGT
jgi:hypothetical protein